MLVTSLAQVLSDIVCSSEINATYLKMGLKTSILEKPFIIVMDSTSYHWVQINKIPTISPQTMVAIQCIAFSDTEETKVEVIVKVVPNT